MIKLKKIVVAIASVTAIISTQVHANSVTVTNASSDIAEPITKAVDKATSAVNTVNSTLKDLFTKLGKQINGEFERLGAIEKSIAQSSVDAQLQHEFKRDVSAIGARTSDTGSACASMNSGIKTGQASTNANEAHHAFVKKTLSSMKYTPSVAAKSLQRQADHQAKYCSKTDNDRGRECTPAADPLMQDADSNPRSLYNPGNVETLTYDADVETTLQRDAALAFVENVVNPYPAPMLPKGWEKTPEGKAYNDAVNIKAAHDMLSANSLLNSVSMRIKTDGLGGQLAQGKGMSKLAANPNASLLAIMDAHGTKFMDPQWHIDAIASAEDPAVLMKEQVRLSAYKSWVDYKTFLQLERIESLLAATYAQSSAAQMTALLDSARRAAEQSTGRNLKNVK